MRLFTAVELDDAVQRELARWIAKTCGERDVVRWCAAEQLHITLKFLGEVPPERLTDVIRIVAETTSSLAASEIVIGALGVFPNEHAPRVLWIGVDDPARLCATWVQRADPAFAQDGIPLETRPFSPHITLARSKSPEGARTLRRILGSAIPLKPMSMRIQRITLFESRLSPQGPRYTALQRAELSA